MISRRLLDGLVAGVSVQVGFGESQARPR